MYKKKLEEQKQQIEKYEKKLLEQEKALDQFKEQADEIQKKWVGNVKFLNIVFSDT